MISVSPDHIPSPSGTRFLNCIAYILASLGRKAHWMCHCGRKYWFWKVNHPSVKNRPWGCFTEDMQSCLFHKAVVKVMIVFPFGPMIDTIWTLWMFQSLGYTTRVYVNDPWCAILRIGQETKSSPEHRKKYWLGPIFQSESEYGQCHGIWSFPW